VSLSEERTYSPDFWLANASAELPGGARARGVLVEIKPALPLIDEQVKAERTAELLRGLPLAIVYHEPSPPYPRRGEQAARAQRFRRDRYSAVLYSFQDGSVRVTHGCVFCADRDGGVTLRPPRSAADRAWERLDYGDAV